MTKLMDKKEFKYFLVFFILALVLCVMMIKPLVTDSIGKIIVIKGNAVSTRDHFRGDYLQLDYEICDVKIEQLDKEILNYRKNEDNFEELYGKELYSVLKRSGEYYVLDKVTLNEPKEGVYLKGKYEYPIWDESKVMKIKGIRINYSLDKYFASENTKRNVGENFEKKEVNAKLKINRGYALLKGIEF